MKRMKVVWERDKTINACAKVKEGKVYEIEE